MKEKSEEDLLPDRRSSYRSSLKNHSFIHTFQKKKIFVSATGSEYPFKYVSTSLPFITESFVYKFNR